MRLTALDDAAWHSPWRVRPVGDKVLLAMGLLATALLAPPWPGAPLVTAVAGAVLLGPARIPAGMLAAAMVVPLAFVVSGAGAVAVTVGGAQAAAAEAIWSAGPAAVTSASVQQALGALAHGVAGISALLVLAMTTPMVDLVGWLRRARIPQPCLDVASATYRLVFLLLGTAARIREAQRGRLGDDGGPRLRLSAASQAAGALLVLSWERGRRLADGLAGRGCDDGDLSVLPVPADRSWPLLAGTVGMLAGVWLVCWRVAG